jgi:hypothetical protein
MNQTCNGLMSGMCLINPDKSETNFGTFLSVKIADIENQTLRIEYVNGDVVDGNNRSLTLMIACDNKNNMTLSNIDYSGASIYNGSGLSVYACLKTPPPDDNPVIVLSVLGGIVLISLIIFIIYLIDPFTP